MENNKKEINLNLNGDILSIIFWSFTTSILLVILINHIGRFRDESYSYSYYKYYESPFGYYFTTDISSYNETEEIPYSKKLMVYITATFKHFKIVLFFWIPILLISIFRYKYNLKVKIK